MVCRSFPGFDIWPVDEFMFGDVLALLYTLCSCINVEYDFVFIGVIVIDHCSIYTSWSFLYVQ